jgi:hypothetical protein
MPTRAAFARPGPMASRFPDVIATLQLSDSLDLFDRGFASAHLPAYLDVGAYSDPTAHAPTDARCVGVFVPALHVAGAHQGRSRVSQVTGPSFCRVPQSRTSPDCNTASPYLRRRCCCLRFTEKTSAPDMRVFRGWIPAARQLVRLRIAGVVTATVARLTSGLLGSTLAGRDSHPLNGHSAFHEVIVYLHSLRTSIAWSQPRVPPLPPSPVRAFGTQKGRVIS